jgi:hypothetical protein
MFDAEAEAAILTYERLSSRKTESAEQQTKIESELRVEIAQRVRPNIEAELRIEIAQRVMSDLEAELRSEIAAEAVQTRAELEKELRPQLEQKLRSEIEKQLRTDFERQRGTHEQELRKKLEEELRPEIERKLRSTVEAELLPSLERALRLQYQNELRPEIEKARGDPTVESAAKPSVDGGKPPAQLGTTATEPQAPSSQLTPPLAFIHPPAAHPIQGPAASAAPLAAPKGAKPTEPGASPAAVETKRLWRSSSPQVPAARPLSRPAAKAPLATRAQAGTKAAAPPMAAPAAATQAGAPDTQPAVAVAGTPAASPAEAALGVHERAQRRARVIVSDLALYDKDTLIKAAQAADSRMELGSLWKEAVRSYNQAVPSAVGSTTNYLGDELDRCLAKLRQA